MAAVDCPSTKPVCSANNTCIVVGTYGLCVGGAGCCQKHLLRKRLSCGPAAKGKRAWCRGCKQPCTCTAPCQHAGHANTARTHALVASVTCLVLFAHRLQECMAAVDCPSTKPVCSANNICTVVGTHGLCVGGAWCCQKHLLRKRSSCGPAAKGKRAWCSRGCKQPRTRTALCQCNSAGAYTPWLHGCTASMYVAHTRKRAA
jgi:hypothetical protein